MVPAASGPAASGDPRDATSAATAATKAEVATPRRGRSEPRAFTPTVAEVTSSPDIFSSTPSNLAEMVKRAQNRDLELKFPQRDFDLGIAMNKDEPKLKEWVNNWVSTNQKNGMLNTIYKKYHGRDLPASVTKG